MSQVLLVASFSQARSADAENEDAIVVGDDAVVVVDGAGLPLSMRAGCTHSVAWFARSIADQFHHELVTRVGSMSAALADAIASVAGTHSSACDLAAGSPSATVAAWRRIGDRLEYLVLCDASLIVIDQGHHSRAITDHRLEVLHRKAADELTRERPKEPPATIWKAARVKVEALRNHHDGFWCVGSDPAAAAQALTGDIDLNTMAGVIASTDGGTRAYDLVASHTLDRFATDCLNGELAAVAAAVRQAEDAQALTLEERGIKPHDDLSLVIAVPVRPETSRSTSS